MSETQGNLITHHNGWNPHFKYHHQLKTKEDAGGRSLGLQRGRRLGHMEEEKQMLST